VPVCSFPVARVNVRATEFAILLPQAATERAKYMLQRLSDSEGYIIGQVYPNLPLDLEELVTGGEFNNHHVLPRLFVCLQIARFVQFVHSCEHVCCGLKPANILLHYEMDKLDNKMAQTFYVRHFFSIFLCFLFYFMHVDVC
jgi:hypothetical protein